MTHVPPEEPTSLSAKQLAQSLMDCAAADPSLLVRQRAEVTAPEKQGGAKPMAAAASSPSMALLADPTLDVRMCLEDLVSIAVSSSQDAQDALRHANATRRKAWRGMCAVASIGVLGLLVGVAGFAVDRGTSTNLTEIGAQARALEDLQREASDQLAEIRTATLEQRGDGEATRMARAIQQQPVPPRQPISSGARRPALAGELAMIQRMGSAVGVSALDLNLQPGSHHDARKIPHSVTSFTNGIGASRQAVAAGPCMHRSCRPAVASTHKVLTRSVPQSADFV